MNKQLQIKPHSTPTSSFNTQEFQRKPFQPRYPKMDKKTFQAIEIDFSKMKEEIKQKEELIKIFQNEKDLAHKIVELTNEMKSMELDLTEKCKKQESISSTLENENASLMKEIQEKDEKIQKLKKAFYGEELFNEVEEERKKNQTLIVQMEERQKQIEELEQKNEELLRKMMKIKDEQRETEEEMMKVESEKEWLSVELKSMKSILDMYKNKLMEMERSKTKGESNQRETEKEKDLYMRDVVSLNELLQELQEKEERRAKQLKERRNQYKRPIIQSKQSPE